VEAKEQRTRMLGQGSWEKIARKGQSEEEAGQYCLDRTVGRGSRTGLLGQDSRKRKPDRTAWTGQPEQTVRIVQQRHKREHRTAET
jgi:hypothetical protein